jgi:hypothetical protein
MIPIRSSFHKVIYERVIFSSNLKFKIFTLGKGINIFFKIFKSILTMLVLEKLKKISYILLVLTNLILLYIFKIIN